MSTPADEDSIASQGIEELAVRVVESTAILNRVIGYVEDRGLRAAGIPRYTPNFDSAKHMLDLPIYGPSNREFELIEDKAALHEYELFDGGVTEAERVQARINSNQTKNRSLFLLRMFRGCAAHHAASSVVLDSVTQLKEVHTYGAQNRSQRRRARLKEVARPRSRNQLHNRRRLRRTRT
jgi:hypothetical protein